MKFTQHFVFRFRTLGSISEGKFETELSLTGGLRRIKRTKGGISDVGIKANEVDMVKEIEEFRPELESVTLAVSPILRQRNIEISDGHSAH